MGAVQRRKIGKAKSRQRSQALCRITNVGYGPSGTSPDISKAISDHLRQRRLPTVISTQEQVRACTRAQREDRDRPPIGRKTSSAQFPYGPLRFSKTFGLWTSSSASRKAKGRSWCAWWPVSCSRATCFDAGGTSWQPLRLTSGRNRYSWLFIHRRNGAVIWL